MKRFMMMAMLIGACATDSTSGGGGGGGSGSGGVGGGGGASEACGDAATALCERFFACLTPQELMAAGFGSTPEACAATMSQHNACSSDQTACNKTFHADQASACIDELGGLTCAELMNGFNTATAAPACNMVCT